jgi:AraC-like DNA-binding protein
LQRAVSSFHSSFKPVTNITPLQYIKNIRLHKARLLMKTEALTAYSAAYEVGYESPSQFNREYKRLFGATPARDVILA